jgi:hypothetical protein
MQECVAQGAQPASLIDPKLKSVSVHRPDGSIEIYSGIDSIAGKAPSRALCSTSRLFGIRWAPDLLRPPIQEVAPACGPAEIAGGFPSRGIPLPALERRDFRWPIIQ